jgi:adenosylcobinamide kinase/adenosylcobinamide-phosphate guanylyltransferase
LAESIARSRERDVVYVATSRLDPADPEWTARIAEHRAHRPPEWRHVETATGSPGLLEVVGEASAGELLLVESVGTWLGSFLHAPESHAEHDGVALEAHLRARGRELVAAIEGSRAEIIAVCEQTGWGLVPANVAGRAFSNALGRLTTTLARRATHAYLAVAGYALDLRAAATFIDTEENL